MLSPPPANCRQVILDQAYRAFPDPRPSLSQFPAGHELARLPPSVSVQISKMTAEVGSQKMPRFRFGMAIPLKLT